MKLLLMGGSGLSVGLIVYVAFLAITPKLLSAPTSAISVVSVRFEERRLAGQGTPWIEAAINLRSQASVVPENICVNLWVLFKEPTAKYVYAGKIKIYSLYDPATVRFYIPPDVVRTKHLSQSPSSWLVEVSSSAGLEPFEHSHASPVLTTPASRAELKTMSSQPLIPHYATPFYSVSDTFRDLPSYIMPQ